MFITARHRAPSNRAERAGRRRRSSIAPTLLLASALVLLLASAAGAAAASPAAPDLSVSLASDAESLTAGDDLTYTATVVNRGAAIDARIVIEPPAFVELTKAEDEGTLADNTATWATTLPGATTTTLTVTATVADIPGGDQGAAALVSVYVNGAATPLIRSASTDRIAGVDDEPSTTPAPQGTPPWALTAWGVVLAIVAVVGLVVLLRRRRPAAGHGPEAAAASDGAAGRDLGPSQPGGAATHTDTDTDAGAGEGGQDAAQAPGSGEGAVEASPSNAAPPRTPPRERDPAG